MTKLQRRFVAGVFFAWLSAVVVLLVLAYTDGRSGRAALSTAQAGMTGQGLITGKADGDLGRAHDRLGRAHAYLSNPLMIPLRYVPFLGRQLSSAKALTGVGSETSKIALEALQQSRSVVVTTSADKGSSLAQLSSIMETTQNRLSGLNLGPSRNLIGPLAGARREAAKKLLRAQDGLKRGGSAANAMATLFQTDGRYLVLAANNAEMRAGSGMFLSVGTLTTGKGDLRLSDMRTVGDIGVPDSAVTVPPDVEALWGWLGHRGDFRNLMLSPRFDISARLAKQIWSESGNGNVDGVIAIDPVLLRALLSATGPVSAGDQNISAENVIRQLLVEQYRNIDTSGPTAASQAERRGVLSEAAKGSFAALANGKWNPVVLVRELGEAADGRHVMVWSSDPLMNSKWQAAGVGGTLTPDSMLVSLMNVGANKLDQFLSVDSILTKSVGASGHDMSVAVTVVNNTPAGLPHYVTGPTLGFGLQAAEYGGLVSFSLPGDAVNIRFEGNTRVVALGPDGASKTIATHITVPNGETRKLVVHFTRPATARVTMVEPSARVPATKWRLGSTHWTDERRHPVLL